MSARRELRATTGPMSIAPFHVHIVVLSGKKAGGELEAAERIYADLQEAGVEVILDDRNERAGVKFNDADLVGVPIRITVGSRGLEKGQVELKQRSEGDRVDDPMADLLEHVKTLVAEGMGRS